MGRRKKILDLTAVEQLAAQGLNQQEIAACLGVSRDTWFERRKEDEAVDRALERGRLRAKLVAVSKLWAEVEKGSLGAIKFYLMTRCGWKPGSSITVAGPGGTELIPPHYEVRFVDGPGREAYASAGSEDDEDSS